jgi:hypothetical protein
MCKPAVTALIVVALGLGAAAAGLAAQDGRPVSVPAGTKWDLQLQTALDSGTSKPDQPFDAATLGNYGRDGRVLVAAASPIHGFVGSVKASSSDSRTGELTLAFKDITVGGRILKLRASVEQLFSGAPPDASGRAGTDAAIEAAVARLPNADRTLLPGVFVGVGGSIASTEGSDVKLAPGTLLRVRLDQPIQIDGGW